MYGDFRSVLSVRNFSIAVFRTETTTLPTVFVDKEVTIRSVYSLAAKTP